MVKLLKLYHLTGGYQGVDVYTDMVVAATSRSQALKMHPSGQGGDPFDKKHWENAYNSWAESPMDVGITYIGTAAAQYKAPTIICTSFHGV